MAKKEIKLGDSVKDKITGFKGIVVGRAEYLTGCVQFAVLPQRVKKDGTIPEWEWLDSKRLSSTYNKKPEGPQSCTPPTHN